jgi:plasmid stabilization system protein ParE
MRDRDEIFEYIAQFDSAAADRTDRRFEEAVRRLVSYPFSARPGEIPGTRELIPHPSYRIVYQVDADLVQILSVIHTARQWPPVED